MSDLTPAPAPRSTPIWRSAVIPAVAVLAIGIGAVAGAFLLNARSAGAGAAAGYLPSDSAMVLEFRLIPSTEQDVALRSILERFPIPGFDPERPAVEQLIELIDEKIAESGEDFRYAEDVEPWWDGMVTVAATDVVAVSDPSSTQVPPMLALLGVTDPAEAQAAVERLHDDVGADVEVGSIEHRGMTIWTVDDPVDEVAWSYVLTDDQLIVASSIDELTAALDRHADGGESFADTEALQRLAADLPNDRLMFGVFSGEAFLAAAADASDDAEAAAFSDALLECGQPTNAAMAMWATEDRLVFETVGDAPTDAFAVENVERGLAAQVPADALAYAEGGSIGSAYGCMVTAFKDAFASDPTAAEGLGQVEALLGADLEEFVSWIDGGAVVAGWDGSEPYAGTILVPSDADAARERVNGLLAFARLATLDGSLGISVEEEELEGVELTTIRWDAGALVPELGVPGAPEAPTAVVLQVAVGDDRVIIGFGDRFATRVLELEEADSLAANERFAATVDELGGMRSAGIVWWDLTATREAVEAALGGAGILDTFAEYETDVKPWLVPLDRMAGVATIDGDRLVQRAVLVFD